jgi:PKD repeat protein
MKSFSAPRRIRWLLVAAFATAAVIVSGAGAATQTKSETVDFTGSALNNLIDTGEPLSGGIFCDGCLPDDVMNFFGYGGEWALGGRVTGGVKVDWKNPVKYDVSYTDSLVRQGETLDMKDVVATQGGEVTASVVLHGDIAYYRKTDENPEWHVGDYVVNETKTIPIGTFDCTIPLPGDGRRPCEAFQKTVELWCFPVFVVDVCLKGRLTINFDAAGTPIASLRVATTAGDDSGGLDAPLSFAPTSPVTLEDHFSVPCTEPAGMDFFYKLTNNAYTALDPRFTANVALLAGIVVPDPFPNPDDLTLWESPDFGLLHFGDMAMSAPDIVHNLGPLQADNRPPVVGTPVAPNGNEGSEIQFHVDATDNCGPPAVRWTFSDGGIGFGTDPKHTFADNGHYTGVVTATDDTGNSTTKTFALDIANVKPSVNAGPDTTDDWGRPVQFNGQATDPGAADQSTLQYSWSFGDGTPSATGGPGVTHAYASPGAYTATLTVCDKNGGCDSDSRDVIVTKRDTTTAYLGDTAGTYDTAATLSASLVDEYGETVNGRSITFDVGSDPSLVSLTNSSGIATKSYVPGLDAGSYTGSSSFAGDSRYNPSSSSNGFTVASKATTTQYTGATTGGPNKTIVLSAVLKDATGKPLAGRTIAFQLGTQSATAVTDANGVAAVSLKLNQKNGTYTVSATYTPAGVDGPRYLGSTQAAIFKLQAK